MPISSQINTRSTMSWPHIAKFRYVEVEKIDVGSKYRIWVVPYIYTNTFNKHLLYNKSIYHIKTSLEKLDHFCRMPMIMNQNIR